MASIKRRPNGTWRARYRDGEGKEHAKHFKYKDNPRDPDNSAQHWITRQTASLLDGTHVDPRMGRTTVAEWCDTWIKGYGNNRPSSVAQARTHLKRIKAGLGKRPLSAVRPSEVRSWTASLKAEGLADSTVYALHARLSQLFADAVHDNIIPKSPVSRRTSPGAGKQRPYVATTDQVWALYDAMPEGSKPAILLGAFAGLRVAELVVVRVTDVDFMRGVITPAIQWPEEPLKTETSKSPVSIPLDLAVELNRVPNNWGCTTLVVGSYGRPVSPDRVQAEFRIARAKVPGLPEGFRIHDLRHYFASLLIASGLDVKVVQAQLRHASAKTTLDTYGHLWPDKDESARAAVGAVLTARADSLRTMPA